MAHQGIVYATLTGFSPGATPRTLQDRTTRSEPVRTISLQEHIRIAHKRPWRLCLCGTIEAVLGRAFTARGVHVEEG
jgi:hypothetical protein